MTKSEILIGLALAVFLALALSPFASSSPDGLERVAEDKGFIEKSEGGPVINSPIPDYEWPGIENKKLATSLAGVSGTLIAFAISYVLAAFVKKT